MSAPPGGAGPAPADRRARVAEAVLPSLRRSALFVLVAAAGWALAAGRGWTDIHRSAGYLTVATALLAVGLFASTHGIDLAAARRNLRLVLLAVTVGVLVKAALISAVMYLAFGRPAFLVLGVAVAQIDPLSFAATRLRSRMSGQAQSILSAWASFDDPVTVLLTVYAAAWVVPALPGDPAGPTTAELGGFTLSLVRNALLAAVAAVAWWGTRALHRWAATRARWVGRTVTVGQLVVLLGLAALAVTQFLLLGLAVAGLFYRPPIGRVLDLLTRWAFLAATFALGLVLVGGVDPVPGVVLGLAAVAAHVVVASVICARLPAADRLDVLLGQQNGITAVILALVLERQFVGTVAVVAPAILVVNLVHALTNGLREASGRGGPGTTPAGSAPTVRARRRSARSPVPDVPAH
ncbi:hypothetical protein [Micromonospora sp. RP3T]|uniref:hypothetical protein n=1 Tax=Micromonospora sp. RP3T TaxID=2135446 RepID=UPI003D70E54A